MSRASSAVRPRAADSAARTAAERASGAARGRSAASSAAPVRRIGATWTAGPARTRRNASRPAVSLIGSTPSRAVTWLR
ncbi:hypothetical protein RB201_09580 [Streptomyces sp. S1A(2023)]